MTAEIKIRYKNPSKASEIFAAARTSHLQGKVFKSDVAITDSDNILVAEAEVKSFLPSWKPPDAEKK
jgi:acyl-coenzyme A thioesterase PaaI-like protein